MYPVIIPRYLIQSLVENSINNNLSRSISGGLIQISATEETKRLCICIKTENFDADEKAHQKLMRYTARKGKPAIKYNRNSLVLMYNKKATIQEQIQAAIHCIKIIIPVKN